MEIRYYEGDEFPIFLTKYMENVSFNKIIRKINDISYGDVISFNDPDFFTFMHKEVIEKINNDQYDIKFTIIRDNITLVKYKDNFSKQEITFPNYKSYTGKCYSLILYLNDDYNSGKTEICFNDDNIISSSGKSKEILIFRSESTRTENIITKGEKKILIVNLIGNFKREKQVIVKFINDKRFYIFPLVSIMQDSNLNIQYKNLFPKNKK